MKAAVLRVILVDVLLALPLCAQYDYGAELFAGPSFLSLKPGEELDRSHLIGWHTRITGYYNSWVGITLDVNGHHGNSAAPPGSLDVSMIDLSQHSIMMGPQVRILKKKRFSADIHFLMGASRGNADPDTVFVDGERDDLSVDNFRFASAVGAAISINLNERLAWRVIEPSYFLTTFGGQAQHSFRISGGMIFRCCGLP